MPRRRLADLVWGRYGATAPTVDGYSRPVCSIHPTCFLPVAIPNMTRPMKAIDIIVLSKPPLSLTTVRCAPYKSHIPCALQYEDSFLLSLTYSIGMNCNRNEFLLWIFSGNTYFEVSWV